MPTLPQHWAWEECASIGCHTRVSPDHNQRVLVAGEEKTLCERCAEEWMGEPISLLTTIVRWWEKKFAHPRH